MSAIEKFELSQALVLKSGGAAYSPAIRIEKSIAGLPEGGIGGMLGGKPAGSYYEGTKVNLFLQNTNNVTQIWVQDGSETRALSSGTTFVIPAILTPENEKGQNWNDAISNAFSLVANAAQGRVATPYFILKDGKLEKIPDGKVTDAFNTKSNLWLPGDGEKYYIPPHRYSGALDGSPTDHSLTLAEQTNNFQNGVYLRAYYSIVGGAGAISQIGRD
jgi:hypothetical protein